MRALANVDSGVVKAEIEIVAAPERVFHALTDPSELAAFWGSDDMYRTFDWKIDLRAGGKWSALARGADGTDMTVDGEYIEVDPPRLLVFTWRPSWDDYAVTRVRYDLEPTAIGTRLRVTHTGFVDRNMAAAGTGDGWKRVLEWLAGHLAWRNEPLA
jgi:glutathione S-transferase